MNGIVPRMSGGVERPTSSHGETHLAPGGAWVQSSGDDSPSQSPNRMTEKCSIWKGLVKIESQLHLAAWSAAAAST